MELCVPDATSVAHVLLRRAAWDSFTGTPVLTSETESSKRDRIPDAISDATAVMFKSSRAMSQKKSVASSFSDSQE